MVTELTPNEQRVALMVDTLTRREGDVLTFEVMDKADPTQRESNIVFVATCSCGLPPERSDTPYCTCGAAGQAQTLTADLRKQYATQLDLTGRLRSVVQ